MTKKREEPSLPVSAVPPDVLWDPAREVTVYAVVPCRGGKRLLEMTTSVEEACAYGNLSDPDVPELIMARAENRIAKQAVDS